MAPIEQSLRTALQGTHEDKPRPIADLEFPLRADRLLRRTFRKKLRPAAVLAPVIRRDDEYSLLLTVRAGHLKSHKGQISLPGGGRDPDDRSAAQNALREAHEEVGLPPERVEVLGYLDDYPTISNYLVTPVIGLVDGDFSAVPDPSEVDEVFEVPLQVVLDPGSYTRKKYFRHGLRLPYFEMQWERFRIWGITGGLLWGLCQQVQAHGR